MIRAQRVVLAAGVWSRELAALVGVDLPVWPRKGHILVTEPAPNLVRHILFEYGYESSLGHGFAEADGAALGPPPQNPEVGTVIQPLPSGQILVGNSREYAGLDRSVNRDRLRQIAQRAVRFIPGLRGLRAIHSYAGLRPWSPDGIPLIGELAERPGLLLATGHGGGGITGGPVTGRIIADLLGGRGYPPGLERLSPDRFGRALYRGAATPGEHPNAGGGA
jgi:sarcosine oxidase subunit beta